MRGRKLTQPKVYDDRGIVQPGPRRDHAFSAALAFSDLIRSGCLYRSVAMPFSDFSKVQNVRPEVSLDGDGCDGPVARDDGRPEA